jgi:hypothetical protein
VCLAILWWYRCPPCDPLREIASTSEDLKRCYEKYIPHPSGMQAKKGGSRNIFSGSTHDVSPVTSNPRDKLTWRTQGRSERGGWEEERCAGDDSWPAWWRHESVTASRAHRRIAAVAARGRGPAVAAAAGKSVRRLHTSWGCRVGEGGESQSEEKCDERGEQTENRIDRCLVPAGDQAIERCASA